MPDGRPVPMPTAREFERAVELLVAGELVALPTETVYGLGADAANPAAVAKIFTAKGRPADHPLIVHLPGPDWVDRWAAEIPAAAWELMEAFWPGPLTLILKKQRWVPDAVTGGQNTVGLRVPGHPVALELLRRFAAAGGAGAKGGVAAPSANRFGRISPTTAAHVREELGDRVQLVLEGGACPVGIESTIVDLSRAEPVILRPGHITLDHLSTVLGTDIAGGQTKDAPRVSGSLEAHYAPTTPMRIVAAEHWAAAQEELQAQGKPFALLTHGALPALAPAERCRRLPADPVGYAHDLYAAMRDLDHTGADLILVEALPDSPAWMAVADRLRRAVTGAGHREIL